ncbi:TetR family transcriptional regulator [Marinithermofilum abyssi]|uniref:TetR family transcriptional regulator n=1 Tax=Marinithermofilum abyssi TaxID=1571185 RepID=A0A8J2VJJ1_9BACL|nr:TetR/AcrR family transcriptional regulator [Marinithermofilum abyssi]GGE25899.1 TetR family transcriptional regulator [Marinithermofilum abyssi]
MSRKGRKEQILQEASHLFSHKGYHGTKIRDISEASGILSGSLYAHIQSKEDLLFEITDRGGDAFLDALRPIVESEAPAEEKFRRGLKAHVRVIAENLEAATVFFHEWKALTDERRKIIQEKRDEYEALWARILDDGERRGEWQLTDAKFTRLLLLSAANGLYQWYRPEGDLTPEEIARRFADILLNGVAGKKGERTIGGCEQV